jgi:hypothetical protein
MARFARDWRGRTTTRYRVERIIRRAVTRLNEECSRREDRIYYRMRRKGGALLDIVFVPRRYAASQWRALHLHRVATVESETGRCRYIASSVKPRLARLLAMSRDR